MSDYPAAITTVNHVEPVPRRIRAFLGGEQVLDTSRALYVWEWPNYPQYYIPVAGHTSGLASCGTGQNSTGSTSAHGMSAAICSARSSLSQSSR